MVLNIGKRNRNVKKRHACGTGAVRVLFLSSAKEIGRIGVFCKSRQAIENQDVRKVLFFSILRQRKIEIPKVHQVRLLKISGREGGKAMGEGIFDNQKAAAVSPVRPDFRQGMISVQVNRVGIFLRSRDKPDLPDGGTLLAHLSGWPTELLNTGSQESPL